MFGSGTTTLTISKEKMNNFLNIVKSLEESGLLIKDVSKNEVKEQKGGFLSMLLGTLGASLLRNLLAGKDAIRACENFQIFKKLINITTRIIKQLKPSTYIDFSKEINYQLPKFKIGDFVRISKYNLFFAKQLCSKLVWRSFCVWNNLKTLFRGYMLLVILKE